MRAPSHARLVGGVLAVAGLVNGVGFILLPPDRWGPAREIALNAVGTALLLVGGAGILLSRRWGWVVALLAVLIVLGVGLVTFLTRPHIAFRETDIPGGDMTVLAFVVLPSLAMLGGLLSPPTLRWLRRV